MRMLVTKAELNLWGHLAAATMPPSPFFFFNILSASPCIKWTLSSKLPGLLGLERQALNCGSLCALCAWPSALIWLFKLWNLSIFDSLPVSYNSNADPFLLDCIYAICLLDNLYLALNDIILIMALRLCHSPSFLNTFFKPSNYSWWEDISVLLH